MTILVGEPWVQIAELRENGEIHFTPGFVEIMGDLGWEAKAFVGHLLALWYDPFEHVLDYTSGEAKHTVDQPGRFDRNGLDEAQDVVEYWCERWNRNHNAHSPSHEAGTDLDLGVEWYRDILRAKLVSIRLPKRLLVAYRDKLRTQMERIKREYPHFNPQ